jgi:hypothetical protein
MIKRTTCVGQLAFDRDAIVRAALRAYIEAILTNYPLNCVSFPACDGVIWKGDLQRGAFNNCHQADYDVVAWNEAGVVGLAYEAWQGPIEQLDLSIDAVTGGPDDVRGALPGLPAELEPVLVLATSLLEDGVDHGEKCAGVGFWLYGDHVEGTFFDDPMAHGAKRLAMWGLLWSGRLWPRNSYFRGPDERASVLEYARKEAPIHALLDAVTDRALKGPTELTPAELETLFPTPPDPERVLEAQRMLQKVGVTWPGSPELPEEPRATGAKPFLPRP